MFNMNSLVGKIKWSVHKETITFVSVILVGALAPLWMSGLVAHFWGIWHGWGAFFQKGELYLYSAAIYTHAIYLLLMYKKKNYDFLAILAWFSGAALLISAISYTTLITPPEILKIDSQINVHFIFWTSIVCFIFSVFTLYVGLYKDHEKKSAIDVLAEERKGIDNIKDQLS